MGVTVGVNLEVQEWLTLLAPGGEAPRFVTLERRWERNDGGALMAMVAHTGDPDLPIVTLGESLPPGAQGARPQWHDDEIGVAGCLLSLVDAVRSGGEPTYGAAAGAAGSGVDPGDAPVCGRGRAPGAGGVAAILGMPPLLARLVDIGARVGQISVEVVGVRGAERADAEARRGDGRARRR
jgi:hypothetical protein